MKGPFNPTVRLLALLVVCFISNSSFADDGNAVGKSVGPQLKTWQIKTIYTDPLLKKERAPVYWNYVPEKTIDGYAIRVSDSKKRLGAWADILLDMNQNLISIEDYQKIGTKEISHLHQPESGKPVLVKDSLIPLNWFNAYLPWDQALSQASQHPEQQKSYKKTSPPRKLMRLTKRIGNSNQTMLLSIRRTGRLITFEQALSKGYLPETVGRKNLPDTFLLLTVEQVDPRNGNTIFKMIQLWPKSFHFWVYEEVPLRRSWYVFN